MTEYPLQDFVRDLTVRTANKKAKWSAETETTFSLTTPNGSVVVASTNYRGLLPYELTISNSDGIRVDGLTTSGQFEDSLDWDEEVAALYAAARANALNPEVVTQGIISAIDKGDDDDIPF